jgi:hypothetical protein
MAISGKLMYMNSIINMQKKKDDITLKRCHLLKLQSNSVMDLKVLTELKCYFTVSFNHNHPLRLNETLP